MRRMSVLLAASIAALGAGGIAATTGGAQDGAGETIRLVSKGGSFKFIDEPPKSRGGEDTTAGDRFLLTVPLSRPGDGRVGTLDAECTFTKGGSRRLRGICEGAYSLKGGEIFILARLADETTTGAVVGGTGDYVGARGTFRSKDRPGRKNGDPSDDTIVLLP